MTDELDDIQQFIHVIPAFAQCSESEISQLTRLIHISYLRQGETIPRQSTQLYIVRKGALCYLDSEKNLLGKFGEGDICSVFFKPDSQFNVSVVTEEDTLLYGINQQDFSDFIANHQQVAAFFEQTAAQRLQQKMQTGDQESVTASSLMSTTVADFYHSPALSIESKYSIIEAAKKMNELNVSCLIITKNNNPIGILTDKDIRKRCVAEGLNFSEPVTKIMTDELISIDVHKTAFDALMLMTSRHVHHLPVTEYGTLSGLVTVTDLMNQQGQNAVNLANIIRKAKSVTELVSISKMLPGLQIRMAKVGASADHVGKSISAVTMAFTMRLVALAQQQLGEAPVPFAWLAAGSQARNEQLAHSDQDNALIIDDRVLPEHDYYFHDLATFVCDGLAACGFIYCPGDIMATNPKWRQPQRMWAKYFSRWIATPDPKALLNSSVFFDLTTVCGDSSLLEKVRADMLQQTKAQTLFIAHLSRNAMQHKPPLGFFRDFVLIQNGKHKSALDIKHNGIAPIVDLARIYALSEGIAAVNTLERLKQAAGTKSLSKSAAANLIDAFEFLASLRLKHQARKLQADEKPDNYILPKAISKLEREHLKDAFKVIKEMQDSRQTTY